MKRNFIITFLCLILPILGNCYTILSGNMSDMTLTQGVYYAESRIFVNTNQSLTIDAGVVIKFNQSSSLIVYGTLDINGTEENPVYFTSIYDDSIAGDSNNDTNLTTPTAGNWDGITFQGNDNVEGIGELDHAIIRYAGGSSASIILTNSGTSYLNNCEIAYSSTKGVYNYDTDIQIDNCSFHDNEEHALFLANTDLKVYSNNTFYNNMHNGITLWGNITENQVWDYSDGTVLILAGSLTIETGVELTVEAGTIFKGFSNGMLSVDGTLDINGTEENPVYFTSLKDDSVGGDTNGDGGATLPQPQDWRGIEFDASYDKDGKGSFDYATIKYGGVNNTTNVKLTNGSEAYFNNCEISYSSGNGISCLNSYVNIDNSLFESNGEYPAYVYSPFLTTYENNTLINNGINGIGVGGDLTESQTWDYSDGITVILVHAVNIADNAVLTVEAGTVFKFNPSCQFYVEGTLDVNGTATDQVYFTSIKDDSIGGDTNGDGDLTVPATTDWYGIHINGYGNFDGVGEFDYAVVKYAGNSNMHHSNIYFKDIDVGYLNNCEIAFSNSEGIKGSKGIIQVDNCNIHDNLGDAVSFSEVTLKPYTNNVITNNGLNGIKVSGTVVENQTWDYLDSAPIIIYGSINVNDNVTLTINNGSVFKAFYGSKFYFEGTLDVNGTEANPVYFTSVKDDEIGGDTNSDGLATEPAPNDWSGISLFGYNENDGIGEFDYAVVKYAGYGGAHANVYFQESDNGYLNNCEISNSYKYGIDAYKTDIEINNCNIHGNSDRAINLRSVTLNPYLNNIITGNGINAISLSGDVNESQTWNYDNGPVINLIGTTTIKENVELTIEAGTIFKTTTLGNLIVNGKLDVDGTEANPVYYTSLQDDTVGGDTNSDGNTTSPAPGDWSSISFDGYASQQGTGELEHLIVKYGGTNQKYSSLYFYYSTDSYLNSCSVTNSGMRGINIKNSSPEIRSSLIADNGWEGIYIESNSQPDLGSSIDSPGLNEIINNGGTYQLTNSTSNQIMAYYNKWGSEDEATIDALINDNDESSSWGEVLFNPWFVESTEIELISASTLDFGNLYFGLSHQLAIIIKNIGTLNLTVSDLALEAASEVFSVDYSNINGIIAPGEENTILATFTPQANQEYNSQLNIINDSSNSPNLTVYLQGNGDYDLLPSVQNVSFELINGDAVISWEPVTETLHGLSVDVDFYVINYSENVEENLENYFHLTAIEGTTFTHNRVSQFAPRMFYNVIAVKDYSGEYRNTLKNCSKNTKWKTVLHKLK